MKLCGNCWVSPNWYFTHILKTVIRIRTLTAPSPTELRQWKSSTYVTSCSFCSSSWWMVCFCASLHLLCSSSRGRLNSIPIWVNWSVRSSEWWSCHVLCSVLTSGARSDIVWLLQLIFLVLFYLTSHVLKNKLQAKLFHTAVSFVDYFTATTCHISDEWKENVGCPRCLPGRLTTIPYQPFTAVNVSNEN